MTMRFRLGLVTGLASGYYLGARAGRQRYDQINRAVAKLKRSDAHEAATERAKTVAEEAAERAKAVVEDGVEKARTVIGDKADSDPPGTNGQGGPAGLILPTDPPVVLEGEGTTAIILPTDPPIGP